MTERWTRDDLALVAMALEEFRDEQGPGQYGLAERVNAVLRCPGDRFVLLPEEPRCICAGPFPGASHEPHCELDRAP